MQVLQADEHSFYWGQPASGASTTAAPSLRSAKGSPIGDKDCSCSFAAGAPLAAGDAASMVEQAPRLAWVSAATFHSIVGSATVLELLKELRRAMAGDNEYEAAEERPGRDAASGAVLLPANVVEVALAKAAGWALDPGARAGTDPEAVRQTVQLLEHCMCLSHLKGYSLDDVASVLWSLASVLGEYGWAPTVDCLDVVQDWLGSSETLAMLQTDPAAGRFSVLASLLWGYAALLQAKSCSSAGANESGGGRRDPSQDVRLPLSSAQDVETGCDSASAEPVLDALALCAAELTRSYGTTDPVTAVELADVAWALSVINRKSSATGQLAEAVAHEVYRQLSNRSSLQAAFEPADLVKVVRAYADMGLDGLDAAVPRMLDAVGGHVAKRIRNRHVGAITRPADCAELLRGFADSGHNTVVIPELLQAVALQICREVSAHNLAAPRPLEDLLKDVLSKRDTGSSSGPSLPLPSGSHGNAGARSSVADRFRQPYTPLWERRLTYWQQLSAEQRRHLEAEERTRAYWHWSSLLQGAQVVSVLQSYNRMGYYPGVDLTDSLLLVVQSQLSYMSLGDVSELLQLLAAARHVPGAQMLALLAAAALRSPDIGGLDGPQGHVEMAPRDRGLCDPKTILSGPASPLQRLSSMWSLMMMGWRSDEPEQVEQVLMPVMLDDTLAFGVQDAGRLMSLLVMLPRRELTIQRFGLAAVKLREALAAAGSTPSLARRGNAPGQGWSKAWLGGSAGGETTSQRQLRATLLASGIAMALLGAEGWEMAEQVLSAAQFRMVEEELRRALRSPYDGVDDGCLAEALQGMSDNGCCAGVTPEKVPVDWLRAAGSETGFASHCQAQAGSGLQGSGDEDVLTSNGDAGDMEFEPLLFQPLTGYVPRSGTDSTLGYSTGGPGSTNRIADSYDGLSVRPNVPPRAEVVQQRGAGVGAYVPVAMGASDEVVAVRLHVCPPMECASNAPDDLVWGWFLVRQALYDGCARGAALPLAESKLRKLKGRREDVKVYVRRALEQALRH